MQDEWEGLCKGGTLIDSTTREKYRIVRIDETDVVIVHERHYQNDDLIRSHPIYILRNDIGPETSHRTFAYYYI